ncbi:MAG: hypothetical protein V1787_01540 [Candidatus Micrarchaeota archaeon]
MGTTDEQPPAKADPLAPLKGFYLSLEDKYYAFAKYLESKGVPFARFFLEPIEKNGIPSFPVFALIILLVLAGALFAAYAIAVPKTAALSVRVVSEAGVIDGAQVSVSGQGFAKSAATKAGVAEFAGLPRGQRAKLSVAKEGYKLVEQTIVIGDRPSFSFSLERDFAAVTIKVLDFSNRPVSLADVEYSFDGTPHSLTSDYEGSAEFSVPGGSLVSVTASAEGYEAKSISFTAAEDTTKRIVLRATSVNPPIPGPETPTDFALLKVSVENAEGNALEARIAVRDSSTNALLAEEDTLFGSATFTTMKVGTEVRISAESDGYQQESQVLTLTRNDEITIVLEEERETGATTVIYIKDAQGKALQAAHVAIIYPGEGSSNYTVVKEARDASQLSASLHPAGIYYAVASKPGYLPQKTLRFYAGESKTITLQKTTADNSASLNLTVKDEDGRVPSQQVALAFFDGDGDWVPPFDAKAVSGRAAVRELNRQSYTVRASFQSLRGSVVADLSDGSADANLTLYYPRGTLRVGVKEWGTDSSIRSFNATAYFEKSFRNGSAAGSCAAANADTCDLELRIDKAYNLTVRSPLYKPWSNPVGMNSIKANNVTEITGNMKLLSDNSITSILFVEAQDAGLNKVTRLVSDRSYLLVFDVYFVDSMQTGGIFLKVSDGNGSEVARITNFSASEFPDAVKGSTVLRGGRSNATNDSSLCTADFSGNSTTYSLSWADLSYSPSLTGTFRLSYWIKVRPEARQSKAVVLEYRSYAFDGSRYFRDPNDDRLGTAFNTSQVAWCFASTNTQRLNLTGCGGFGQDCCSTRQQGGRIDSCDYSYQCLASVCRYPTSCGSATQYCSDENVCCADGGSKSCAAASSCTTQAQCLPECWRTAEGLYCDSSGAGAVCTAADCGSQGKQCCGGIGCEDGLRCSDTDSSRVCVQCGAFGQDCCDYGNLPATACLDTLQCVASKCAPVTFCGSSQTKCLGATVCCADPDKLGQCTALDACTSQKFCTGCTADQYCDASNLNPNSIPACRDCDERHCTFGEPGGRCNPASEQPCTSATNVCVAVNGSRFGVCEPCGTENQKCCPQGTCSNSLMCSAQGTCFKCGAAGEPCCTYSSGSGPACLGELACKSSQNGRTCEPPTECGSDAVLCTGDTTKCCVEQDGTGLCVIEIDTCPRDTIENDCGSCLPTQYCDATEIPAQCKECSTAPSKCPGYCNDNAGVSCPSGQYCDADINAGGGGKCEPCGGYGQHICNGAQQCQQGLETSGFYCVKPVLCNGVLCGQGAVCCADASPASCQQAAQCSNPVSCANLPADSFCSVTGTDARPVYCGDVEWTDAIRRLCQGFCDEAHATCAATETCDLVQHVCRTSTGGFGQPCRDTSDPCDANFQCITDANQNRICSYPTLCSDDECVDDEVCCAYGALRGCTSASSCTTSAECTPACDLQHVCVSGEGVDPYCDAASDHCGARDLMCCSGVRCNAGLACVADASDGSLSCQNCGGVGMSCCSYTPSNPKAACGSGLQCLSGSCQSATYCGSSGNLCEGATVCCADVGANQGKCVLDSQCTNEVSCAGGCEDYEYCSAVVLSNPQCRLCDEGHCPFGGPGEFCDPDSVQPCRSSNNVCVPVEGSGLGTCQPCGGESEIVCDGGVCNAGLVARNGRCALPTPPCGGFNEACCSNRIVNGANDPCDSLFQCIGGTCWYPTLCGSDTCVDDEACCRTGGTKACVPAAQCSASAECDPSCVGSAQDLRCVSPLTTEGGSCRQFECGTLGKPCCAGVTCTGGLACSTDSDTCVSAGAFGQSCRPPTNPQTLQQAWSACDTDMTCVENRCAAPVWCGSTTPACQGRTVCCADSGANRGQCVLASQCNEKKSCAGGCQLDEYCDATNLNIQPYCRKCDAAHCVMGGSGQLCDPRNSPACDAGNLACIKGPSLPPVSSFGRCQECGRDGKVCCDGNLCAFNFTRGELFSCDLSNTTFDYLQNDYGACRACGYSGQPCCPPSDGGEECFGTGLMCDAGSCRTTDTVCTGGNCITLTYSQKQQCPRAPPDDTDCRTFGSRPAGFTVNSTKYCDENECTDRDMYINYLVRPNGNYFNYPAEITIKIPLNWNNNLLFNRVQFAGGGTMDLGRQPKTSIVIPIENAGQYDRLSGSIRATPWETADRVPVSVGLRTGSLSIEAGSWFKLTPGTPARNPGGLTDYLSCNFVNLRLETGPRGQYINSSCNKLVFQVDSFFPADAIPADFSDLRAKRCTTLNVQATDDSGRDLKTCFNTADSPGGDAVRFNPNLAGCPLQPRGVTTPVVETGSINFTCLNAPNSPLVMKFEVRPPTLTEKAIDFAAMPYRKSYAGEEQRPYTYYKGIDFDSSPARLLYAVNNKHPDLRNSYDELSVGLYSGATFVGHPVMTRNDDVKLVAWDSSADPRPVGLYANPQDNYPRPEDLLVGEVSKSGYGGLAADIGLNAVMNADRLETPLPPERTTVYSPGGTQCGSRYTPGDCTGLGKVNRDAPACPAGFAQESVMQLDTFYCEWVGNMCQTKSGVLPKYDYSRTCIKPRSVLVIDPESYVKNVMDGFRAKASQIAQKSAFRRSYNTAKYCLKQSPTQEEFSDPAVCRDNEGDWVTITPITTETEMQCRFCYDVSPLNEWGSPAGALQVDSCDARCQPDESEDCMAVSPGTGAYTGFCASLEDGEQFTNSTGITFTCSGDGCLYACSPMLEDFNTAGDYCGTDSECSSCPPEGVKTVTEVIGYTQDTPCDGDTLSCIFEVRQSLPPGQQLNPGSPYKYFVPSISNNPFQFSIVMQASGDALFNYMPDLASPYSSDVAQTVEEDPLFGQACQVRNGAFLLSSRTTDGSTWKYDSTNFFHVQPLMLSNSYPWPDLQRRCGETPACNLFDPRQVFYAEGADRNKFGSYLPDNAFKADKIRGHCLAWEWPIVPDYEGENHEVSHPETDGDQFEKLHTHPANSDWRGKVLNGVSDGLGQSALSGDGWDGGPDFVILSVTQTTPAQFLGAYLARVAHAGRSGGNCGLTGKKTRAAAFDIILPYDVNEYPRVFDFVPPAENSWCHNGHNDCGWNPCCTISVLGKDKYKIHYAYDGFDLCWRP